MSSAALVAQLHEARAERENVVLRAAADADAVMDFARTSVAGLRAAPKWLDCRFLYDARGSELFKRICEQPEYYPTRTEAAILAAHAGDIARTTGPLNLVELGSGSSTKTAYLLNAYLEYADEPHYVPIDVSAAALREAQATLSASHPDVQMSGIIGTYESAFPLFRELSPAMVIFLGSTIGNMNEEQARVFWTDLVASLQPDDYVLLGVDLVKDSATLEAAYNDAAGVTAQFTHNLFARMNRELDAGIDLGAVRHVAVFSEERSRIETYAEFRDAQDIHVAPLDATFRVGAGERVMIEISRKFDLNDLLPHLAGYGLAARRVFTDDRDWFALVLLQRTADHA